jgi:DamX protein
MAEKQKIKEEVQAEAKKEPLPAPALPKEEPVKIEAKKKEKEVEPVAKEAKTHGEHFTIQLLGSSSEANVKKFIAHHGLGSKAQYVRSMRGEKEWFVVYYGNYPSMEEAKAAILTMPPSLKKEGVAPWIKRA